MEHVRHPYKVALGRMGFQLDGPDNPNREGSRALWWCGLAEEDPRIRVQNFLIPSDPHDETMHPRRGGDDRSKETVSYTHLTLPTTPYV